MQHSHFTSKTTDSASTAPAAADAPDDIGRVHVNARMSRIVQYSGLVFLCGQTASASASENSGIKDQVREALSRVDALLSNSCSDRERILAATLYLPDITDFVEMNEVWDSWIPSGAAPARTTVQARLASENLLFEIMVIAARR